MLGYVRKIEKAKWLQNKVLDGEDVSADAITVCMKTKSNRLSVWSIESDDRVDEAALAMISAFQHLDTIDVVILSPEYLIENGIESEKSDGNTRIDDLKKTHYDLVYLTYTKLGVLAHHIVEKIPDKKKSKRYTKFAQKTLLLQAIEAGRLSREDLHESVRKELDV